jgi:hypothetical protein
MKGDFSRDTFDPLYNFSRVLLQQGRVQLDADFNEQTAILLHMLRRLTADLVGPYAIAGGPDAFRVTVEGNAANRRLMARGGRAYVGGHLVEVPDGELRFPDELEPNGAYIVFLDVWERHVTYHETAAPIREVALGGPDTATRAQVVCRLRAVDELRDDAGEPIDINVDLTCDALHRRWPSSPAPGFMSARAVETRSDEACVVPSDSRYRGLENQLYRVEVHAGGDAAEATFKWSRDNGSVVFPLAALVRPTDTMLALVHLGRDERFGLRPGDWVEIVNDDSSLNERFDAPPPPLHQVVAVDPLERTVTLAGAVGADMALATRPLLRRWDQRAGEESEGGLTLVDGAARLWRGEAGNPDFGWLALEDGIEVQFVEGQRYRRGDYWLIPARTATGGIEWPQRPGTTDPRPMPARRAEHYTMPLGVVIMQGNDNPRVVDCRRCFGPLNVQNCNPD